MACKQAPSQHQHYKGIYCIYFKWTYYWFYSCVTASDSYIWVAYWNMFPRHQIALGVSVLCPGCILSLSRVQYHSVISTHFRDTSFHNCCILPQTHRGVGVSASAHLSSLNQIETWCQVSQRHLSKKVFKWEKSDRPLNEFLGDSSFKIKLKTKDVLFQVRPVLIVIKVVFIDSIH